MFLNHFKKSKVNKIERNLGFRDDFQKEPKRMVYQRSISKSLSLPLLC